MSPSNFTHWLTTPHRHTLVMGILNITPDSFSDGAKFFAPDAALARAEQIAAQGADLIDIGGESTRPGSDPVPEDEQIRRVIPTIKEVAKRFGSLTISIDTRRAIVAQAALDAGATLVNDVSAGRDDPAMLQMVARRQVPVILMHLQGDIKTMQINPTYTDVVAEIKGFLSERIRSAQEAGIDPTRILIDPGIGFGKGLEHNLTLLRRQSEFLSLNYPLVIGTSRKKFIGTITGVDDPSRRLVGTLATTAWAVANGAAIVRVHDVEPNVQTVRIIEAIAGKSR